MEPKKPVIMRKRFIPMETVNLASDELLYRNDTLLITRWRTLRPKKEFGGGVSFYFLDRNYKVSRFYGHDGAFLYWYCDVIDVRYDPAADTYIMADLLLDVRVYPDGRIEVLDADELEEAHTQKLITQEQFLRSKTVLETILREIRAGAFPPPECADRQYW